MRNVTRTSPGKVGPFTISPRSNSLRESNIVAPPDRPRIETSQSQPLHALPTQTRQPSPPRATRGWPRVHMNPTPSTRRSAGASAKRGHRVPGWALALQRACGCRRRGVTMRAQCSPHMRDSRCASWTAIFAANALRRASVGGPGKDGAFGRVAVQRPPVNAPPASVVGTPAMKQLRSTTNRRFEGACVREPTRRPRARWNLGYGAARLSASTIPQSGRGLASAQARIPVKSAHRAPRPHEKQSRGPAQRPPQA